MCLVVVMDCDCESLGAVATALEATGREAIPVRSGLRGPAYCERQDSPCDAVFVHLNNSGAGAGLWLADRIATARLGVPAAVISFVFRTVPDTMPQMITLWPKPVTRQAIRDVAAGRGPAALPPVTLKVALH